MVSVHSPKKPAIIAPTKTVQAPLRTLVAKELKQAKHESNKARRQRAKARHNDSLNKRLFDDKIITDTNTPTNVNTNAPKKPTTRSSKTIPIASSSQQKSRSPNTLRSKAQAGTRAISITNTPTNNLKSCTTHGSEVAASELKTLDGSTKTPLPSDLRKEEPEFLSDPALLGLTEVNFPTPKKKTETLPAQTTNELDGPSSTKGVSVPPLALNQAPVTGNGTGAVPGTTEASSSTLSNSVTVLELNYTSELEKWRFDLLREEQEIRDEIYHKQVSARHYLTHLTSKRNKDKVDSWRAETRAFEDEINNTLIEFQNTFIKGGEATQGNPI